ncbi:S-layer homology domain-containing protein [Paenibacillus oryzisoli]|uniref:hemoblobin-interacting domain-containing protein n=1 Tax=Paenibacillus oryzisoli TaxID=1850517 RepID=UPI003D290E3E
MKLHIAWKKALHLLLALALVVPGLLWSQSQTYASGPAWRDIKSNADSGASYLAGENGKLYLLYGNKILVRGASDANWSKLVDLPANQFTQAYKLVVRNGDFYILDRGNENALPNAIPSKIMKSVDNGQTWTDVPGPAGGFSTLNGNFVQSMFFDTQGNLYAVSIFLLYKRDTSGTWTIIAPKPPEGGYQYRYTSAGVDALGHLYSIMMKTDGMSSTAAVYAYNSSTWNLVNVTLSGGNMTMFVDAGGGIHIANGSTNFMLTSKPHIYTFDGSSLDNTATTSNSNWTIGGVVFDGEYYYILDYSSDGIIRTTSPTFGNLKSPPTLTADTSDNDTAHDIELTYPEDADWQNAITAVDISPSSPSAQANWTQADKITITGLTKGGSYTVKVKATGYSDASAVQTVSLVPSVWYDITADSSMLAPVLSVSGVVYGVQLGEEGLFFRSESDMRWQSQGWPPQEEFGSVYTYVARGNDRYIGDLIDPMTPNSIVVRISADSGSSWSSYPLPQNAVTDGALNPLTVSQTGAVYLFGSKNLFKLDESRNWSQIPVLPDAGDDKFAYTGVAVNAAGTVFANIRKYNSLQPLNNAAKLYKLDTSGSTPQWVVVADSPSAMMNLYTDTAGGMHATTGAVLFGETPGAYVYQLDENGFTQAATLDSLVQAKYGVAYENGYYYIVDGDDYQTIRTTNPNFNTGLASPALTADTSNNDDAHLLDLTFTDDADWRSQITGVTVKKSETVVEATYQVSPGMLHITQPLEAGTYTIEIAAAGYKKSIVQQTVLITSPTLVADSTNNDTEHDIEITFADNGIWRNAVTSVVYNGQTADSSAYVLSEGLLLFKKGTFQAGAVTITMKAAGYPDASVTQVISAVEPPPDYSTGPGTDSSNKEIIQIDVLGGSSSGSVVSQAEIVRTKDDKGLKHDQVSLTSDLAARAVEALQASGTSQAVIVVPDTKDEVADVQVSLPREALEKLTNAGVGLTIETRGASIQIPVASLSASSGDLYFHVVPVKDAAAQQEAGERAKANGSSQAAEAAVVVGRPMTIETNLQSQPVQLTLPLGDYTADKNSRLMVYIEHSDGTKEWVKGEPVSDDAGKPAIRFTVTKFSTFTIIDAKSALPTQAYIEGYEDGTFRPEAAVTRGQLAAMLDRLYGNRAAATDAKAPAYGDSAQFPAWAVKAISVISALGFMDGYEDGEFKVDRAVTRAEAAAIFARVSGLQMAKSVPSFTDTQGHWAAGAIEAAAHAGLLDGYEDGSFAPDRELSRAEAVTMLNRVIGRPALTGKAQLWSDVPVTYWAFGAIQAASSSVQH